MSSPNAAPIRDRAPAPRPQARRAAIIGYGVEGRAAAEYWSGLGWEIVVHDTRSDVDVRPGTPTRTGDDYLTGLDDVDLIVRSPGVRPDSLPRGAPVTSVIREFFDRCPGRIIGVTGTKGKGTTVTAIAQLLRAGGRKPHVGGNIGQPPLRLLPELTADDIVVLELSSFQLMDLTLSPQIAVVLSVTPDHLEWHRDLAEYHRAKSSIARHQRPGDLVVYDAGNRVATEIADTSAGRRVAVRRAGDQAGAGDCLDAGRSQAGGSQADGRPDGSHASQSDGFHVDHAGIHLGAELFVPASEVPLRGAHNLLNVAVAIAATYDLLDHDAEAIRAGVRAIEPLPHRLEPVAVVDGVTYVNDSLSTTPETTIAAMEAYDEPQVLILGGSTKGVSFALLAHAVADRRPRAVLLVGAEAPRIAAALEERGVGYEHVPGPMTAVVRRAAELAEPGDVVLLSPACASFGDFRNYADRGEQFARAARALPA